MKPLKRNSKQRLWDECDALWSKIVKAKYKGRCGICGGVGQDPHHIARKNGQMRWLIPNGIWLCRRCHDHDHEHEMNIRIEEKIGLDMFVLLYELSQEVRGYKKWELEELKESLKEQLELLLNRNN